MKKQTLALTTLLTIILILIAAIVGALVAYTWTMAPFYLEPQSVDLIVTDANFPVNNAKYFGVTIMNPSHSISDTNITDIYITAEGFNATSATDSNPSLPFTIGRGTTQTVNCSLQWGAMAGKLLTVHVASSNSTGAELTVQTESVSLGLNTFFDSSKSIDYFNFTVTSISSPINLTLNQVLFDYAPVNRTYLNVTLPQVIHQGEKIAFTCYVRWEGYVNPLVSIQTAEGYSVQKQADARGSVSLQITKITFNSTDKVDLTLSNPASSTTAVDVSKITFKHGNATDIISGNLSTPALPITIEVNKTAFLECSWPWSQNDSRNIYITVTANTTQGFVSTSSTLATPPRADVSIDTVDFDLDNTGVFTVNVTNWQYSLSTINITGVNLNNTPIGMNQTLSPGQNQSLLCPSNWSTLVGAKVRITVTFTYESKGSSVFLDTTVPYVKVADATFTALPENTPTVSITIRNSEFSKVNATIMGVQATIGNVTLPIAGAIGYEVNIGSQTVIVCPWNWKLYSGQDVTLTVLTQDGAEASATFRIA
jgi:hypothetical protein